MSTIFWALLILLATIWAVAHFYLRGPDLSAFDAPTGPVFEQPPSEEYKAVLAALAAIASSLQGKPRSQHLEIGRAHV